MRSGLYSCRLDAAIFDDAIFAGDTQRRMIVPGCPSAEI